MSCGAVNQVAASNAPSGGGRKQCNCSSLAMVNTYEYGGASIVHGSEDRKSERQMAGRCSFMRIIATFAGSVMTVPGSAGSLPGHEGGPVPMSVLEWQKNQPSKPSWLLHWRDTYGVLHIAHARTGVGSPVTPAASELEWDHRHHHLVLEGAGMTLPLHQDP